MGAINSLMLPFKRIRTVNSTIANFTTGTNVKVATATKPSGTGSTATNAAVLDIASGAFDTVRGEAPVSMVLIPFGSNAANETFLMRVLGWRFLKNSVGDLWIPVELAQFTCTLGARVGVDTYGLVAADLIVDTITGAAWNPNNVEIVSPASDLTAHVMLDIKGFPIVEVLFELGTGDSGNALASLL